MTNAEFWNSTPREFHYRQKGYFAKMERLERREWERTRWQTSVLMNIKPPTDLAVFPWEKEQVEAEKERNKPDPKAVARMAKAMDDHAKKPTVNNKPVKITELLNHSNNG